MFGLLEQPKLEPPVWYNYSPFGRHCSLYLYSSPIILFNASITIKLSLPEFET